MPIQMVGGFDNPFDKKAQLDQIHQDRRDYLVGLLSGAIGGGKVTEDEAALLDRLNKQYGYYEGEGDNKVWKLKLPNDLSTTLEMPADKFAGSQHQGPASSPDARYKLVDWKSEGTSTVPFNPVARYSPSNVPVVKLPTYNAPPTGTTTQLPTQYFNNPTDFWNWISKNTPLTPSNLPGIPGPPTTSPAQLPVYNPTGTGYQPTGMWPPSTVPSTARPQYGSTQMQPSPVPAASGPEALAQRSYPQSNFARTSSPFRLPTYYDLPKLPTLDLNEQRKRQNTFNPFPKYRA